MNANPVPESPFASANPFSAADVEAILRERGWLTVDTTPEMKVWLGDAAALLGPQAANCVPTDAARSTLQQLLSFIFFYDARALLDDANNQTVIAREGAREVIRELANHILFFPASCGAGIDSRRYQEIIESLKASLHFRGRELFHPIRLALAGRAGEGELDRIILLLDGAASLGFASRVKGTCQRMIEFCAALR
jgi:nondiscriminating glutamyl-tRNA synthetase